MELTPVLVASFSLIVSALAFLFSRRSWRETYRPIVTARIVGDKDHGAGPVPVAIKLENVGNRPAVNVRIQLDRKDLAISLMPNLVAENQAIVDRLLEERVIGVIPNGKSRSGYIGKLAIIWKAETSLKVTVFYSGLDGRKFRETMPLILSNDVSFTGFSATTGKDGNGEPIRRFPNDNDWREN
jgi:hypothetical protein